MQKRGRPLQSERGPKTGFIVLRVNQEERAQIGALASMWNVNQSDALRRIVGQAVVLTGVSGANNQVNQVR